MPCPYFRNFGPDEATGLQQSAHDAAQISERGPDAAVEIVHTDIHGDETDTTVMLRHSRACENAVDLDDMGTDHGKCSCRRTKTRGHQVSESGEARASLKGPATAHSPTALPERGAL